MCYSFVNNCLCIVCRPWVHRFIFVYLLFILLVSGNEIENHAIDMHFENQYEAPPSVKSTDNFPGDQSNRLKVKDGLTIKREALKPGLILRGSLNPGLIPVGMNAQIGPGINLNLNQPIKPNLIQQNGNPGELSVVSYPVHLFVMNPKDMDKKLSDIQMTKIPFDISNKIPNNKNGNNSNDILTLNDSIKNLLDVIGNLTPRPDSEKSANVTKVEDINDTTLLSSTSNKTATPLEKQKDDYSLKDDVQTQINITSLPNNQTDSEGNSTEDNIIPLIMVVPPTEKDSEPINETDDFKISEVDGSNALCNCNEKVKNTNTLDKTVNYDDCCLNHDNAETKPINEELKNVSTEKVNLDDENLNKFQYGQTKKEMESDMIDTNRIGLLCNQNWGRLLSNNKPYMEYLYNYPFYNQYFRYLMENQVPYNNFRFICNDNMNSISDNTNPVFKYQNSDIKNYQNTQNVPNMSMYQTWINSDRNGNNVKDINDKNLNIIQQSTNYRSAFRNPTEFQNIMTFLHDHPEILLENHDIPNNVLTNIFNKNSKDFTENHRNINSENRDIVENHDKNEYPYNTPTNKYNGNTNINNQENTIRPQFNYAFENQRPNAQYQPGILEQNLKSDDSNERNIYKEQNNDASILFGNNAYFNNIPWYAMVNLIHRNSAKSERIQWYSYQHPLITCNGLYINQNLPTIYPIYGFFPYVYRNIPN